MGYLAAAYGVVWAGTFLYLVYLSRRERALEREIKELQARLPASDQAQAAEGKTSGMGR